MSSNEAEGAAEPCKDADGRRRLSRFPLHKPFEKQPATTAFSEVALRLIVDFYSDAPYVIGTAVVICGHLLITARHVVEDMVPVAVEREGGEAVVEKRLTALQLLAGPEYVLWDCCSRLVVLTYRYCFLTPVRESSEKQS